MKCAYLYAVTHGDRELMMRLNIWTGIWVSLISLGLQSVWWRATSTTECVHVCIYACVWKVCQGHRDRDSCWVPRQAALLRYLCYSLAL
jgi:hypothetical protein